MDLSSAFDTVPHDKLRTCLFENGVLVPYVCFLRKYYQLFHNFVKLNGQCSPLYPLQKGVRRSCPSSGFAFGIYLDRITVAVSAGRSTVIKIGETDVLCLIYAEDVVLLASDDVAPQNPSRV